MSKTIAIILLTLTMLISPSIGYSSFYCDHVNPSKIEAGCKVLGNPEKLSQKKRWMTADGKPDYYRVSAYVEVYTNGLKGTYGDARYAFSREDLGLRPDVSYGYETFLHSWVDLHFKLNPLLAQKLVFFITTLSSPGDISGESFGCGGIVGATFFSEGIDEKTFLSILNATKKVRKTIPEPVKSFTAYLFTREVDEALKLVNKTIPDELIIGADKYCVNHRKK